MFPGLFFPALVRGNWTSVGSTVSLFLLLLNQTLMVAPSRLFNFANSSMTPFDGYLLSLYKASRAIFCKSEIEWSPRERKEWKNRTYETGTCRKHDNSGSKTTLKGTLSRWKNLKKSGWVCQVRILIAWWHHNNETFF